jgi:hypothetical protein
MLLKYMIDIREILSRSIKYLIEGSAIALAAYYIKKKTDLKELAIIAITGASIFAILDFHPSISKVTRQGAGLGIGLQHVGAIPAAI